MKKGGENQLALLTVINKRKASAMAAAASGVKQRKYCVINHQWLAAAAASRSIA